MPGQQGKRELEGFITVTLTVWFRPRGLSGWCLSPLLIKLTVTK